MAMLVPPQDPPGYFLGMDVRPDAIAAAERGIFPLAAAADIPLHLRAKHVTVEDNHFIVRPHLRALTHWRQGDVFHDALSSSSQWDVILCRNLAIYLDAVSSEQLWTRLITLLAPGGTLVVGKAERVQHPEMQRVAHCVYRKHPVPAAPNQTS